MKRQALTLDRMSLKKITDNHYQIRQFNIVYDYSFQSLFSITVYYPDGATEIFCRQMDSQEKRHSGHHFNAVQPNHKKRLSRREWKKVVNKYIQQVTKEVR